MQERFRPMAMGERFFHSDSAGTEELQDIPPSHSCNISVNLAIM